MIDEIKELMKQMRGDVMEMKKDNKGTQGHHEADDRRCDGDETR